MKELLDEMMHTIVTVPAIMEGLRQALSPSPLEDLHKRVAVILRSVDLYSDIYPRWYVLLRPEELECEWTMFCTADNHTVRFSDVTTAKRWIEIYSGHREYQVGD